MMKHQEWRTLGMINSLKRSAGIYSGYKTHQQSLATALKYVRGSPELLPPVAKPVCAQMGGGVAWGATAQGYEGSARSQGIKNGTMAEESGRDLYFRHGKRRASSPGWRQSFATRPLPLPPSKASIKHCNHLHFFTPAPTSTHQALLTPAVHSETIDAPIKLISQNDVTAAQVAAIRTVCCLMYPVEEIFFFQTKKKTESNHGTNTSL